MFLYGAHMFVAIVVERHGLVQTVLDTVPRLIEHVISNSDLHPKTRRLSPLITAGIKARRRTAPAPRQGRLLDPLTPGRETNVASACGCSFS